MKDSRLSASPAAPATWTKSRLAMAGVVALVAFVVYANALTNGLHVDDQQQIVDNEWIKDASNLPEIFSSGVWDHAGRTSSYYRPFMYVLYMATYLVFGLQPWAFHLVNILFHVGCSVLVWGIAARTLQDWEEHARFTILPSLVAGLLFATHPIHTEAVAWAAGIADVSYSFFCLLALLLYMLRSDQGGRHSAWLVAGSVLSFFIALLCKEPALGLPVVLVAGDWLLRKERPFLARSLLRMLPYAVATGFYLWLRLRALGGVAPAAGGVDLELGLYVINALILFSRYLEALVLPVGLNFWHVFEPATTLLTTSGLRALLVVGAFLAASCWALRYSRAALYGLILMVVPLLPAFHVSALNQGLENAFAERYLYLPSAGYVLFLAGVLAWVGLERRGWYRPLLAAALSTVVLFGVATVRRNPVWRDAFSLWSDALEKSPDSAVVQMNYGYALLARGRLEEGRQHLRRAHELDSGRIDVKIRNALAYASRGNLKQGVLELSAALELDPDSAAANYNIAILYERMGWRQQAVDHYRRAVASAPGFAAARNNLAILLAEAGDLDGARRHFEAAVQAEPGNAEYRANLERLRGLQSP